MALVAGEPCVLAGERVTGQAVVERRSPRLAPVDELELGALVLDVALPAVAVLGAGVQALAGGDSLRERLVARQALPGRDAFLRVVAVEAARAALELGVRAAQRPGRDLGRARRERGDRQRGQQRTREAVAPVTAAPPRVARLAATATCTTMNRYITSANGLCITCQ